MPVVHWLDLSWSYSRADGAGLELRKHWQFKVSSDVAGQRICLSVSDPVSESLLLSLFHACALACLLTVADAVTVSADWTSARFYGSSLYEKE